MIERQDQITTATVEQMYVAFDNGWNALFQESLGHKSVLIFIAHWALETGWGKKCHNWNLGNTRTKIGSDTYDWVLYECGEDLDPADAKREVAKDPKNAWIVGPAPRNPGKVSVLFRPPHPTCCFRAFASLEEGVIDYIGLLHKRFPACLPGLRSGDAVRYVTGLKQHGYFTASIEVYLKTFTSVYGPLQKKIPFPVEAPPAQVPDALSPEAIARRDALIALTYDESIREYLDNEKAHTQEPGDA